MTVSRNRAIGAVIVAAICWASLGTAYALFRDWFALDEITIVTLRGTVASVMLYAWLRLKGRVIELPARADIARITLLGLSTVTGFYLVLIYAFSATSVPVATLILYLAPSLVALGAFLWLGERLNRTHIVALALSFLGCALVARIYSPDAITANGWGLMLCFASAIAYASYSLQVKPLLARIPSETIILGHLVAGSVGLLIVKLVVSPTEWASPAGLIAAGLFTGLVLTVVPLVTYTFGLRGLPASEAATIATLEPVLATIVAWVVLEERLDVLQLLGGGLVVASVVLLATSGAGRFRKGLTVMPRTLQGD
jgi:drug/metabolite transporter (DMT)-like permease